MGPSPEDIAAAEARIEEFQTWLMQQPDQQFPVIDYVRDDKGNILYFAENSDTVFYATSDEGEVVYRTRDCPEDPEACFAAPKEIRRPDKAYPLCRPERAILKTFVLWMRIVEQAQTQDSDTDGR